VQGIRLCDGADGRWAGIACNMHGDTVSPRTGFYVQSTWGSGASGEGSPQGVAASECRLLYAVVSAVYIEA
jgi:hypothetical protein